MRVGRNMSRAQQRVRAQRSQITNTARHHPESSAPRILGTPNAEPGPTPSNRYIFTEVLAPALLAGLLLWYTLADVLALIGRVAEAVLVYIKAGAVSFVETVEHYASKLHS